MCRLSWRSLNAESWQKRPHRWKEKDGKRREGLHISWLVAEAVKKDEREVWLQRHMKKCREAQTESSESQKLREAELQYSEMMQRYTPKTSHSKPFCSALNQQNTREARDPKLVRFDAGWDAGTLLFGEVVCVSVWSSDWLLSEVVIQLQLTKEQIEEIYNSLSLVLIYRHVRKAVT